MLSMFFLLLFFCSQWRGMCRATFSMRPGVRYAMEVALLSQHQTATGTGINTAQGCIDELSCFMQIYDTVNQ